MSKNQPVLERFFDKVILNEKTDCWEFTSSISKSNCGTFFFNGGSRDSYKIGYLLLGGWIPAGYDLHHICENRLCVNPEHLLPVSKQEHHAELSPTHIAYKNKRKTHCPQGHPYTEDNLVPFAKGRRCLACARKRSRECNRKKNDNRRLNGLTKDSRIKWTAEQIIEIQTSKIPAKELMDKFGISQSRLYALRRNPETARPQTIVMSKLKNGSRHQIKDPYYKTEILNTNPGKSL